MCRNQRKKNNGLSFELTHAPWDGPYDANRDLDRFSRLDDRNPLWVKRDLPICRPEFLHNGAHSWDRETYRPHGFEIIVKFSIGCT